MCTMRGCRLLTGIAVAFAAAPALAGTVIVPTDQATVQAAVNAAGEGGTVVINSSGTFNETVTVTQSMTIHAGVGFTPTIRGTGTCGLVGTYCTLIFSPNSASAQMLAVSGVRLLPGGARATGPEVVRILNMGSGDATAVFSGCTIENPQGFGFQAVNIRRASCSIGLNHVAFQNGSIAVTGQDEAFAGEGGFEMPEGGSLTMYNTELVLSGVAGSAFQLNAKPGCGDLDFSLSYSTVSVAAPAGYDAYLALLVGGVTATIEHNAFQLSDAAGIGAFGNAQPYTASIALDANRFVGSGPQVAYAVNAAPYANGSVVLNATNNAMYGMGSGFEVGQQVQNPAGAVTATLANNTVDGSRLDGIALNSASGSTLTVTAENNLVTNSAGWGISLTAEAGGSSTVSLDYNGFFDNSAGDIEPPLVGGAHDVVGDPIYVNRPDGDLRLGIGSPMIDAGSNSQVSTATDAAGAARIQNATVDIGAFEGAFTVTVPTNTPSTTPTFTGTPTKSSTVTNTATRTSTTATATSSRTATSSATATPSPTVPSTATVTHTRTATHTATPTHTASVTAPATVTKTREPTSSPPVTPTGTSTSTAVLGPTQTATPTSPSAETATPTPMPTGLASQTATARSCVGDCNGSGSVSIANLVVGVNIALGNLPPAACPAFENAQGMVDIAQLVKGVNNALNGCHGG